MMVENYYSGQNILSSTYNGGQQGLGLRWLSLGQAALPACIRSTDDSSQARAFQARLRSLAKCLHHTAAD